MTRTPPPGNDDLMKAIEALTDQVADLTDEVRTATTMTREWAEHHEQLTGHRCMAPDCDQPATTNIHLWSRPVGRVCEQHGWDFAANNF